MKNHWSTPKIKVWSFDLSSASQIVRLALVELGLDSGIVPIDLFAQEHITPEYARINPKMLVPSLEYNGSIITDSWDILNFLKERHEDLHPTHDLVLKR